MNVLEKVAYFKGLLEGMDLAEDSKEGKLFKAAVDVMTMMAEEIEDLQDTVAELTEQVDTIDEDLDALETDYYDDDDDCDCDCCCDEDEDEFYDITCPKCDEEFSVDETTLLEGGIDCPNCGEHLEFEIDCDCDCDDDCCCDDDCDCDK